MDRRFGWLAALALAIPVGARAQGGVEVVCTGGNDTGPLAVAPSFIALGNVGGQTFSLLQCLRVTGKVAVLNASFTTPLAFGEVHATFNSDPFINFNLATTALVPGPTFMQFTFGTPIVPALYTNATSSLGGSVTAGIGAGSATNVGIIPFLTANGTVAGIPIPPSTPGNLGVDIGVGPCTTAVPPALPTTVNCPAVPAAGANAFAPTFYDDLDATVTYNQSGVLSQVAFNGRVDLFTAVPEPTSVALTITSLLTLAGVARSRRRTV
jgi:hypothetical protein